MKNYIFTVWLTTIFFVFTHSFCMELTKEKYFAECKKINENYDNHLKKLIMQVTDDNVLEMRRQIERTLQTHAQGIGKQTEVALSTIKIKYEINDALWKGFITIMQELQKFREDRMWKSYKGVVHDATMPQWFVSMLKKELLEVGFNPQQTHLCNDRKIPMGIEGIKTVWSYRNGGLDMQYEGPGRIVVNCEMLNLSLPEVEEGRCMLLAQVIKLHKELDILRIVKRFGIKIDEKEDVAFAKLTWTRPLFAAALKNPRGAHCIKSYCSNFYAPADYSVEDYEQLSSIDLCWKGLEWLKKYYSNNYHCISLSLKVKDGDVATVSGLLDSGMVVTKKMINDVKETKKDEVSIKELLQEAYYDQWCCVCDEHPEDMRDMPCDANHIKRFICRQCYNNRLGQNELHQKICPLCQFGCFSYNTVTM